MPWKKITTITEAAFEQEAGSSLIDVSDKVKTRNWMPTREEQKKINQDMKDSLKVYNVSDLPARFCGVDGCETKIDYFSKSGICPEHMNSASELEPSELEEEQLTDSKGRKVK